MTVRPAPAESTSESRRRRGSEIKSYFRERPCEEKYRWYTALLVAVLLNHRVGLIIVHGMSAVYRLYSRQDSRRAAEMVNFNDIRRLANERPQTDRPTSLTSPLGLFLTKR